MTPQQLRKLCTQLFANILNNYQTLRQRPGIAADMPLILEEMYRMVNKCEFPVWYMHAHTNGAASDLIHRKWTVQRNEGELYHVNSSADQTLVNNAIQKYGLPISFYPTTFACCHLTANLKKSSKYQTIVQKVQREIGQKSQRDSTPAEVALLNPIKTAIGSISALAPLVSGLTFKVQDIDCAACYQDSNTIFVNANELRNSESFTKNLLMLIVRDV